MVWNLISSMIDQRCNHRYFVWGSLLSVGIAMVPLIDIYEPFFIVPPDTELKAFDDARCWILLIISSIFFTVGSYIFVRAFDDPPPPAMFKWYHISTDELLAAWLYLFATAPALPYCIIYLNYRPDRVAYWAAFIASVTFVIGSSLFVYTCYPENHALKVI